MRAIAISSGHGLKVRGAEGYLDEVDEARRVCATVVEMLKDAGVTVAGPFNDDISTSQSENLNRIVNWHNSQRRALDVSIHFNCFDGSAKGHECLYLTQQALAAEESNATSAASGFINRGAKKRTDLAFLNGTDEPAILIEVCFVDNAGDADLYRRNYEDICQAIAEVISDQEITPIPPEPPEPHVRPTLSKGSYGPDVIYLQQQLNEDNNAGLAVDGQFGSRTESAVMGYQASRHLDVDGVVGPLTWEALETNLPPYIPPDLPPPLTESEIEIICDLAMNSDIADYNWHDRGMAPPGYTKGMALSFANTYRKFLVGHSPALEMAKARTDSDKDALEVYRDQFNKLGMSNEMGGEETLRHLYALMLGQGMRESSGRHCEGRDMTADNVSSDTCEAGLMQTSYNAHSCHWTFDQLFEEYTASATTDNPQGFLNVFSDGVYCDSSSWSCYGSGNGALFQRMCKVLPAFAVESAGVTLRNLCNHYGPIIRKEAELRQEADDMFKVVQDYIDQTFKMVA